MNHEEFLQFLKSPHITHSLVKPGCWKVSSVGTTAFGFSSRRTQRHWLLSDGKVYNYWQLVFEPPSCLDPATRAELETAPTNTEVGVKA